MLNKIIIPAIGIGIIVTVLIIFAVEGSTQMSLEQIIENKDCKALEEWGDTNKFNENLNLRPEQLGKAMKLEVECDVKAMKNIFDTNETIEKEEEYDVLITLDKHQYKVGERMQIEVTITPKYTKGITIGIDSSGENRSQLAGNKDSKWYESWKIEDWGIGTHTVNLRDASSPTGYLGDPVEFEIID